MTNIGFLSSPCFVWGGVVGQSGSSDTVLDIASGVDFFCPKYLVAIHVFEHCPRGIEQCTVQP
jgi:hypothetical protein